MSVEEIQERIDEARKAFTADGVDKLIDYVRSLEILLGDIIISLKPWDK